ncbi:hypothetical protein [Vibrio metschnikovii]|uniref:Uncharacterized protein n=1 Tax=Vibrio metschnikovii TaxID=28172 RepID=A0A9X0RBU0_VIBME|nr:hypothetical protein [Vibrio metschnikovii]MBC5852071.1 hypothetical protein [Vibrio metschnikovii]
MNNKVFFPNYEIANIYAGIKICDFNLSRNNNRKRGATGLSGLYSKISLYADVYSALLFDRYATIDFDYIIVGQDHLVNAIVASELASKGMRVMIHATPEENLPKEIRKIDRYRFQIDNEKFSRVLSKNIFDEQLISIDKIIERCFSIKSFSHGAQDNLPVINTNYDQYFTFCEEENKFHLFTSANRPDKENDKNLWALKKNLPSLKLLKGREKKGFLARKLYFDSIIRCDKIIETSRSQAKLTYVDGNQNIVKVASSKKKTDEYKRYTIADRMFEILDTLEIINK